MTKVLVTILFALISFSFIAENIIAHTFVISKTMMADEDATAGAEEGEQETTQKENIKDKFFSSQSSSLQASNTANASLSVFNDPLFCQGFTDKPYMPPKMM